MCSLITQKMLLVRAIMSFTVKHGPGICVWPGPWACNLDENLMSSVSNTMFYSFYFGTLEELLLSL